MKNNVEITWAKTTKTFYAYKKDIFDSETRESIQNTYNFTTNI